VSVKYIFNGRNTFSSRPRTSRSIDLSTEIAKQTSDKQRPGLNQTELNSAPIDRTELCSNRLENKMETPTGGWRSGSHARSRRRALRGSRDEGVWRAQRAALGGSLGGAGIGRQGVWRNQLSPLSSLSWAAGGVEEWAISAVLQLEGMAPLSGGDP
jgi:hypothetical protein